MSYKILSTINPKINFYEIEYYLENRSLNPHLIENSEIYNSVKKLTDKVCFSSKDKYEKRWEDFYLPLRRRGKLISIPFGMIKYKRDFFCYFFHLGSLHIKRGNKIPEKIFRMTFQETIKFLRIIKKTNGDIVKRTVPFDFRTGKINWRYSLRVTNYAYAEDFIRMVKALVKNEIPFIAQNLEEVLDYLAGETYFTVNDYSENSFFYIPSQEYKKKFFKYIEWDKLRILK
ncbi:MAG: hypothetical protein KAX20_01570 [Candidatus Omnitrophica bacterium]|nr:hypothetical protein [Candidatus Omnitrophota bacterium]